MNCNHAALWAVAASALALLRGGLAETCSWGACDADPSDGDDGAGLVQVKRVDLIQRRLDTTPSLPMPLQPPPTPSTYITSPYEGPWPFIPAPADKQVRKYLGLGYHIILADPHAPGEDPGFRGPIIDTHRTKVATKATYSCQLDSRVDMISGARSAQASLARSAGYDNTSDSRRRESSNFFGTGGETRELSRSSFTGSESVQTMSGQTVNNDKRYFEAVITCSLAEGRLEEYITPTFTESFQHGVESLPVLPTENDTKDDLKAMEEGWFNCAAIQEVCECQSGVVRVWNKKDWVLNTEKFISICTKPPCQCFKINWEAYDRFIDAFGTHFTKAQACGGMLVHRYEMAKDTFEDFNKEVNKSKTTTDIAMGTAFSAEYGVLNAAGSLSEERREKTEEEKKSQAKFQSLREKISDFRYYRGRGAFTNDTAAWANTLRFGMVPVPSRANKLGFIPELLTPENFESMRKTIARKRNFLKERLLTLCMRMGPLCIEEPLDGILDPVVLFPRMRTGNVPVSNMGFNGQLLVVVTQNIAIQAQQESDALGSAIVEGVLAFQWDTGKLHTDRLGEPPFPQQAHHAQFPLDIGTTGEGMVIAGASRYEETEGAPPWWLVSSRLSSSGQYNGSVNCKEGNEGYRATSPISISRGGEMMAYAFAASRVLVRKIPATNQCVSPWATVRLPSETVRLAWQPNGKGLAAITYQSFYYTLWYHNLSRNDDGGPQLNGTWQEVVATLPGAGPFGGNVNITAIRPLVWRSKNMLFTIIGNLAEGRAPIDLHRKISTTSNNRYEAPRVHMVDMSMFKVVHSFQVGRGKTSFASAIDASPDGKYLAVAWTNITAHVGFHVWDLQTEIFEEVTERFNAVFHQEFQMFSPRAADCPTPSVDHDLSWPQDSCGDYITSLAFSEDSNKLAIGSSNGQVVVAHM